MRSHALVVLAVLLVILREGQSLLDASGKWSYNPSASLGKISSGIKDLSSQLSDGGINIKDADKIGNAPLKHLQSLSFPALPDMQLQLPHLNLDLPPLPEFQTVDQVASLGKNLLASSGLEGLKGLNAEQASSFAHSIIDQVSQYPLIVGPVAQIGLVLGAAALTAARSSTNGDGDRDRYRNTREDGSLYLDSYGIPMQSKGEVYRASKGRYSYKDAKDFYSQRPVQVLGRWTQISSTLAGFFSLLAVDYAQDKVRKPLSFFLLDIWLYLYISLFLSQSVFNGALESPCLLILLSYSTVAVVSHTTIILTFTLHPPKLINSFTTTTHYSYLTMRQS